MYLQYVLLNPLSFYTLLLGVTAIIGDSLVSHSNLDVYKAIFDNSTHSIIGGLTWFIITLQLKNKSASFRIFEIFLCALIASVIDLDHFLMAKSFHLKVKLDLFF